MKQAERMIRYSSNFNLWLTERWGDRLNATKWSAFEGAYLTHQWDGTPDPFDVICQSLADRRWVGVESGTGTGKTWMLARIVFWFLDTMGGTVITTAPKEAQLKDVLWKEIQNGFGKFRRIQPHAEMFNLRLFPNGRFGDASSMDDNQLQQMKISKAIGIVAGVGANEESAVKMQGYHDDPMLIVVDECAGVPPAVMKAIKNTSTDPVNNLILCVGNPDNMTDQLHEFCEMQNVVDVRISAKDHPNVVLGRKVIPGAVTRESIAIRTAEYGVNSPFFQSRVCGKSPKQAADSLFNYEWLERMLLNLDTHKKGNDYNAVGVDAANSEAGDMAALVWGRGSVVDHIQEFHCPDASHLGYNLIYDPLELAEKGYKDYGTPTLADYQIFAQCVGVDGVGIGISTVQALRNDGQEVVSLIAGEKQLEAAIILDAEGKPIFKFADLRSQMYWQAAKDAEKEFTKIDTTKVDRLVIKQLFKELIAHKYSTKGGKTRVMSKDDVKKILNGKSPNLSDAYVYWNWMRRGYYLSQYIPIPNIGVVANDDDF